MRAVAWLGLVLATGCSCDEGHPARDAGEVPEASLDSGRDASRDADLDGPADADADATQTGDCAEDEEAVDVTRVEPDLPDDDCGPGCVRVTSAPVQVDGYDIYDSVLVFTQALVKGASYILGWVDLARGEERHVAIPASDLLEPTVATDGRFAYYATFELDTGIGRLWKLDVERACRKELRELHRLDDSYGDLPEDPDASGDWLVWWDERSGSGGQDVFGYDLRAGQEVQLTNDHCCVAGTRIFGTTVVYTGWSSTPYSIWTLDVVAGGAHVLWEGPGEQDHAAIHGTRAVFESEVSFGAANRDIVAVDVETGEQSVVCDQESPQRYPDVHGDLVVWEDCRNAPEPARCRDNVDVYGEDLTNGGEIAIATGPGFQYRPRVWGETVYFKAASSDRTAQVFAIPFPR